MLDCMIAAFWILVEVLPRLSALSCGDLAVIGVRWQSWRVGAMTGRRLVHRARGEKRRFKLEKRRFKEGMLLLELSLRCL